MKTKAERRPCESCGAMVLPDTLERNEGHCAPCAKSGGVASEKISDSAIALSFGVGCLPPVAIATALSSFCYLVGMHPLLVFAVFLLASAKLYFLWDGLIEYGGGFLIWLWSAFEKERDSQEGAEELRKRSEEWKADLRDHNDQG